MRLIQSTSGNIQSILSTFSQLKCRPHFAENRQDDGRSSFLPPFANDENKEIDGYNKVRNANNDINNKRAYAGTTE
jgi:hypothetical protein